MKVLDLVNSFLANVPNLYALETPEIPDVFRGCKMGIFFRNVLMVFLNTSNIIIPSMLAVDEEITKKVFYHWHFKPSNLKKHLVRNIAGKGP